jgi:acyl-CoA thioester hydrolase
MIDHEYTFRVMYPDTDKMGVVHHSAYVKYFETARWELFRSIGLPYSSVEKAGYLIPVFTMKFKFLKPAYYDEQLTVKTTLKDIGAAQMSFTYKLYNEQNVLINEAETQMAFVGNEDWCPCRAPEFVVKAIDNRRRLKEEYE